MSDDSPKNIITPLFVGSWLKAALSFKDEPLFGLYNCVFNTHKKIS